MVFSDSKSEESEEKIETCFYCKGPVKQGKNCPNCAATKRVDEIDPIKDQKAQAISVRFGLAPPPPPYPKVRSVK